MVGKCVLTFETMNQKNNPDPELLIRIWSVNSNTERAGLHRHQSKFNLFF